MNNLEIHNMLTDHRRNVLRLVDIDPDLKFSDKMKLLGYAKKLRARLDNMAVNIHLQFVQDADQQIHHAGGSDQEPNGDTVGTFQHARTQGD